MQKALASARVHVTQRQRFASEDEQHAGPRTLSDSRADFRNPPLDLQYHPIRSRHVACLHAQAPYRGGDIRDPPVAVVEYRNTGSLQLRFQCVLSPIGKHEVRTHREDALGVRIQERTHPWQRLHLRGIVVIAADGHHAGTCADRVERLGERRYQRDNSTRRRLLCREHCRPRARDSRDGNQPLRTSSHRKNGPPIIAVTMPTGSSTGAMAVRAIRSQPTRNDAPNSAATGSTTR